MIIKNGEVYKTNYERAAAYFIGTLAPCPEEQVHKEVYALIKGMYELFANDVKLLGYKPFPDAAFGPWEQQRGREKDVKTIRGAIAKIEAVMKEFYNIVVGSEVTGEGLVIAGECIPPKRALARLLEAVGISVQILASESAGNSCGMRTVLSMREDLAAGLKELAAAGSFILFSRGVYDPKQNWLAEAFDRLLDAKGELIALCNELENRGYKRIDCKDQSLCIDYVRNYGKKEEVLKKSWAERNHAGIEVSFEELRYEPCFLWVRMPEYKKILQHADAMPDDVRAFAASVTKTCDGCRYCIQTDKTGQRPIAAVKIDGISKCPMFPGFSMNWRSLSKELSGSILKLLEAVDNILG